MAKEQEVGEEGPGEVGEEVKVGQDDPVQIPESQAVQRKRKEEQVRATINQKLVETGERERLEEYLRTSLIECGWRDELKQYCKGNAATTYRNLLVKKKSNASVSLQRWSRAKA